ncbi:hypothetical protein CXB51_016208 [Gossypium anomalum]|uniref:Transmembrane protein n=1 Tax=Gossypium anomalum TaxID=47600 RepID=A0A8J6CXS0_9ROSI|nr:hypothetical protein CXB51_016208 [Gossypium anomalum]
MNPESDSPKITLNYSNLCLNFQTTPCLISKSDHRISLIPMYVVFCGPFYIPTIQIYKMMTRDFKTGLNLPLGFPLEFFFGRSFCIFCVVIGCGEDVFMVAMVNGVVVRGFGFDSCGDVRRGKKRKEELKDVKAGIEINRDETVEAGSRHGQFEEVSRMSSKIPTVIFISFSSFSPSWSCPMWLVNGSC